MSVYHWAAGLEGNPGTAVGRIRSGGNAFIAQAMLSAITYRAYQYDTRENLLGNINPTEIGAQATIPISSSVFDTFQTDAYWTDDDGNAIDARGYNFRFTFPSTRFPLPAKWYKVEITFTPSGGSEPFKVRWVVNTSPVSS